MSEKKEGAFIMCLPTAGGQPHVPSEKSHCTKCGAEVWISPASRKLALKYGAKAVCAECMLKRMDTLPEGEEIKINLPTKEQLKEMEVACATEKEDNRSKGPL